MRDGDGAAAANSLALVRMNALEVGQHDLPVERVVVLDPGVLYDGVGDGFLVVIGELAATARTGR
jgi:hypothetical protein